MKKYKVIALSVGGLGNKVFSAGDEVTEDSFPAGNAPMLVEQGFLELLNTEAKKAEEMEAQRIADELAAQELADTEAKKAEEVAKKAKK